MSVLDLLIRGGRVLRGFSGEEPEELNLGIKDGRVVLLSKEEPEAVEVIEAKGYLILPGFIDVHNHSDFELIALPTADSSLHQGVTTLVIGNCGYSAAPLPPSARDWALSNLRALGVQIEERDLWTDLNSYLRALPPLSVNVAILTGHGNLREMVLGLKDVKAEEEHIMKMRRHLERALEQGARGMSLGLIYPPGLFSTTHELIELAKVVAGAGGIVASHQRSEGRELFMALEESFEIARRSGVRFQISHLKAARPSWGRAEQVISMLREAREELDIWADQYPYDYSSTGLSALFPRELQEGGVDSIITLAREQPNYLVKVLSEVDHTPFDRIWISESRAHPEVEGKSVQQISEEWRMSPEEVVVRLLLDEGGEIAAIYGIMIWEDVERILREPMVAVSSDSSVRSLSSPGRPHPRAFGAFARALEMGLRGELPLNLVVYKMSELPARIFNLKGRGAIDVGRWADLVVIDPVSFKDNATKEKPKAHPSGVKMVLVNGRIALRDGEITSERAGRIL